MTLIALGVIYRDLNCCGKPVFNKASALEFPSTILTNIPLDTWWCPGITKCQETLELEKASPMNPAGSNYFEGLCQSFPIVCQI